MFVGRGQELDSLQDRLALKCPSFIVIRGRRRIGKSRLIKEYAQSFEKTYFFTGLPPVKGTSAQQQRNAFAKQMTQQGLPSLKADSWADLFWALGQFTKDGRVLIVLDEIAWIGSRDVTFLGQLKIAWDQFFSHNRKLAIVVASSVSSWIDENILKSTGFFGRIDVTMTLEELSLSDCCQFWGQAKGICIGL